ncbi:hypothetical protein AB0E08_49660 [Streptomyces sp. NPDC048281]|uniref:hypothetical protein n=1 Tax=Streptomyces sp. NPDC048281 TaxID=3154715 RepID=UPI00342006B8
MQLAENTKSQWGDQVRCPAVLPGSSIRCSLPRRHAETHHRCDAVTPEVRWPVQGNTSPEVFGMTDTGFWTPIDLTSEAAACESVPATGE